MKANTALLTLYAAGTHADGVGLIGFGKTMYNPTCAFACRNVIKGCKLLCTPTDSDANHGTHHNPVATPPTCYVKDHAFLRTMAICLDTYCPLSDKPSVSLLENYWSEHLGTGTLGDLQYVPAMSYVEALAAAREDEKNGVNSTAANHGDDHSHHKRVLLRTRHNDDDHAEHISVSGFMTPAGPNVTSTLPTIKSGAPLNTTSFITPADWQKSYNGMLDFEANENGHSTYTITIMLVAVFLPVPLSLLRFIPGLTNSRAWTFFHASIVYPAFIGKRHREPVSGNVGMVPTRGQALYIALISLLNLVFLVAPYVSHHPQATFSSPAEQQLSSVGNRAGVLAMGNVVAVFLFSARNNLLVWITDWSHGTYLLLHRWLGYWAALHTVIHSLMLLEYYKRYGSYETEQTREYWIWGIVATIAVVAILPTSLLVVRVALYEFFLASHIVLALLFIIGYYYHIWYCYEYNWGYEIWVYLAGGIWGLEHVVRLVRMSWRGYRTAEIGVVKEADGEYLRIDLEGVQLRDGVAYLCFPTLSWWFWETHPFSVAFSSVPSISPTPSTPSTPPTALETEHVGTGEKQTVTTTTTATANANDNSESPKKSTTTFYARIRYGMTYNLAARCKESGSGRIRIPVIIDGPYPHSGALTQLSHCSGMLYIAGGVGITALLPHLLHTESSTKKPGLVQLHWGTRKSGLAADLAPVLARLPAHVEVHVSVGQRLDLDRILERSLIDEEGALVIVVCGPPEMADHVRHKVVQLARSGAGRRPYVLVDEAFSW